MTDDDLDERLRAGLDLLAREAGEPPSLFVAEPTRLPARSRHVARRWVPVAAIALVGVVAAGLAFALTRPDPDRQVSSGEPTTSEPLIGTRWWLTDAADGGNAVEIPTEGTPSYELRFLDGGSCDGIDAGCYSGPRVEGSDACNGVSRKMTIDGDSVVLGEDYGAHTAMGCAGGLPELLQRFFQADGFTYAIDGDQLVLTSTDARTVLTYEAFDTPFGPTSSPIVDEGEIADHPYRLVASGGGLDLEVLGWGSAGVGADPGRVNAMMESVDGRELLFGVVPENAARVSYQPRGNEPNDEPQEMEILHVEGSPSAFVGEQVHTAASSWDLVAYDAAGNEIDRLRWNPQG